MTTELDARIKKRSKALAKDILKVWSGSPIRATDKDLVMHLVQRAFATSDELVTARQAYEFYLANKVSGELAWQLSGLANITGSNPKESTDE